MSQETPIIKNIMSLLETKYGFQSSSISLRPKISIDNEVLTPDIIVYSKEDSKELPILVVEVKQTINPLYEDHLLNYLKILKVPFGILSDGINFVFYYQVTSNYFVEIPGIPFKGEGQVSFRKDSLNIPANLLYKFEKIAWIIADSFRLHSRFDAVKVLLTLQKIIVCKIFDESNAYPELLFYVGIPAKLKDKDKFQVPISELQRVHSLFDRVKESYRNVFDSNEKLELDDYTLTKIVLELQSYSITIVDKTIFRDAYEGIMRKLIEKEPQIHITPKQISDFVVRILRPSESERVIDPYARHGEFLISCLTYVEDQIRNHTQTTGNIKNMLKKYAESKLYGIESSHQIASIAKISMIINGDGHNNIFTANALMPNVLHNKNLSSFDLVVISPPINMIIYPDDYLQEFKFRREFNSRYVDPLFIELGLHLLKSKGRMAIILPDTFLFSKNSAKIRNYLLDNRFVNGIISFPPGVIDPFSKIKVSLILLDKSQKYNESSDYKIFMAEITTQSNQLESYDPNQFDVIVSKYHEFLSGKEIQNISHPNIFLVNASNMHLENWTVRNHNPIFSDREFRIKQSKLSVLVDIIRGVHVPVSKYYDHPDNTRSPYIRISDIINGRINFERIKFVEPNLTSTPNEYRVKEGDILLSIKGTIGKTALISKESENAVVSSQLVILRIKRKDVIDPQYLYYTLSSSYVKEQTDRAKTGAFISMLPIGNLRNINVPLPSLAEQRNTVNKMKVIEKEYELAFNFTRRTMAERINNILMEMNQDQ